VQTEGGHCYGMALFAERYYTGELDLSLPDVYYKSDYGSLGGLFGLKTEYSANGYDLKNTYFTSSEPLYNFKLDEKLLDINGSGYREWEDAGNQTYYRIDEASKATLDSLGYEYIIKSAKHNSGAFKGKSFKYDFPLIDLTSPFLADGIDNDSFQLLSAIYRHFIMQYHEDNKSENTFISFRYTPDKAYESLTDMLGSDRPVAINLDGHAVNAIGLYRDIKDPNILKLAVYDNNYAKEIRYVTVNRKNTGIFPNLAFNGERIVNKSSGEYLYDFVYGTENLSNVNICDIKTL
jgi:hypothetical protein